jgi:hypothetical protein
MQGQKGWQRAMIATIVRQIMMQFENQLVGNQFPTPELVLSNVTIGLLNLNLSWLSAIQATCPVLIQSGFHVNKIRTLLEAYLGEVNSNAALLFQYLQVEHRFDE